MNVEAIVCDRYSRAKAAQTYTVPLFGALPFKEVSFPRSWNVAPESVQPVMFREGPGTAHWGFTPTFAGTKRPMLANCRLNDRNGATWKTMWRTARVIVPADGWYEWSWESGKAQPYFVKPIDDGPVYLAGLSSVTSDAQAQQTDGFVLVTSSAEPGIADKLSHRPVALTASDAMRWLDPKTTFSVATKMMEESLLPRPLFLCFRVSVGVNRVGNDEPAFNDPLPDDITAPDRGDTSRLR